MPPKDSTEQPNFAASLRKSLKATFSPATAQLLQEAVSAQPDFGVIASILKLDPALATAILSLVNSPFYGQSGKISDLQRAAIILGNNEILRIALSLSLQNSLTSVLDKNGFDAFANWRIIVWSAIGSELLAETLAPEEKETAYICALVKDLSLLLYAATYPERLLPNLQQPDFVRTGHVFAEWHEFLPEEHAALTAELLEEWHFPEDMITAIVNHHDLDHVYDYPPLTQAVIFGTRWAEVEFRSDPSPESLAQLKFMLGKVLKLSAESMEDFRKRCSEKFGQLCSAMNIRDLPPEERLYAHSFQSIQDFHYQAKEIEGLTGGNEAIAACIARHLRWNWNFRQAELIITSPRTENWEQFSLSNGVAASKGFTKENKQPDKTDDTAFPLVSATMNIGMLRVPEARGSVWAKAELTLYTRLLSRSLERQLATVGTLEIKAELLDILPTGVALLSATGRILRANPIFSSYLDSDTNYEGKSFMEVFSQARSMTGAASWTEFLLDAAQPSYCTIYCPLGPRAISKAPSFALSCYKIRSGQHPNILVLLQDLTEIQFLEFEALGQRDFLHSLINSMQDLVMTTNQHGILTYVSGKYGERLLGTNLFSITQPVSALPDHWSMDYLMNTQGSVEVQLTVDDKQLLLELLFSPLASGPDHALIVARDISNIRRLERKIKEQALFDSLTQIFNRHHLQPILEREISRSHRSNKAMGIIFFDIDKFKQFNDSFGHHAGDKALKHIGQLLRGVLRKGFDYPCRFGGDEFVIVSTNTTASGLKAIGERVQKEFAAIHHGKVTLSIGMSLMEPNDNALSLLERGDKANYQAKASGGNAVVHLQTDSPEPQN